jgi:hypothetical protein
MKCKCIHEVLCPYKTDIYESLKKIIYPGFPRNQVNWIPVEHFIEKECKFRQEKNG